VKQCLLIFLKILSNCEFDPVDAFDTSTNHLCQKVVKISCKKILVLNITFRYNTGTVNYNCLYRRMVPVLTGMNFGGTSISWVNWVFFKDKLLNIFSL
jgi:hypothetical protein